MMYCAAIVPTIDEAETIGDLVRALDKTCDRVLVVDDSVLPWTTVAAEDAGAEWWASRYDGHTYGLGYSYKLGHRRIASDWYVVHIDAGGSHDPADVYPMLELAEEGFDVVIGSRFCPGGEHHGSWRRRFTS